MSRPYNSERREIPKHIRREIEIGAGHKCSVTTCQEHTYLEIHHINQNREDSRKENLILLCDKHHKMAHAGIIDRTSVRHYKEELTRLRNSNDYIRSQEGDRVLGFLDIIQEMLSWDDEGHISFIDDQAGYWFPVEIYRKISKFFNDEKLYLRSLRSHDPAASASQDRITQALDSILNEISNSKYIDSGGYAYKFSPKSAPGTPSYDREISEQTELINKYLRIIQSLMHELWDYTERRVS